MIIITGLGNPGEKYENTCHNIGFLTLDEFANKNSFPEFNKEKIFDSLISKGSFKDREIILVKPQTFMNASGVAIKKIFKKYPLQLIIVHDDIDLPEGKIKISEGRGSAGHKGIESVIKELKTKEFIRIRVGIQPKAGKPKRAESFVLKKMNKEKIKTISRLASEAIETILQKGSKGAMNEINR